MKTTNTLLNTYQSLSYAAKNCPCYTPKFILSQDPQTPKSRHIVLCNCLKQKSQKRKDFQCVIEEKVTEKSWKEEKLTIS